MQPDSLKILVVGPSWVGDMVMAQSLFMALKNAFPGCAIDVLAPKWTFSLLDRMPEVANKVAMPVVHGEFGLLSRLRLGKQLVSENYHRAYVLPNSWKSALVPFFAKIPVRTGYIGECRWGLLNDTRKLNKQLLTMTVQRFVALAFPANQKSAPVYFLPAFVIDSRKQQAVIEKFEIKLSNPILALCPGAEYGSAKRWPPSHFIDVAKHKIEEGWQVWLLGSEKDQPIASQIRNANTNNCFDFTGKTTLAEVVDLMSLVDAVVSNDSGLMHIAAALNKNLIALYGSSDPGFTPPLNEKAQIVSLNLECSPCFKRECPLYPPGHQDHTKCLARISPMQVLDLLNAEKNNIISNMNGTA